MSDKLKTAIIETSHCAGCEVAIADMGETLLELLEKKIDLVYAPILMSAREYGDVDLALVIGSVKNNHDEEKVQEAREKADILVSFGACTTYSGVFGIGNLYTKEDQLGKAYQESVTVKGGKQPSRDVPEILEDASPISEYVEVDYSLPGCPPSPPLIADFLTSLIGKVG